MPTWAIGVEYDGGNFHGWQHSPQVATVQADVEQALSQVANEPIKVVAAGRTDAGVHATGQVVSFCTDADRESQAWLRGGNALTGKAVSFSWVEKVTDDFHARFSAQSRRYIYIWQTGNFGALSRLYASPGQPMDVAAMHAAAQYLIGEQDFSAFRGAGCQSKSPVRHVYQVTVTQKGAFVCLDITANSYVLHMVRNIAGGISEIGLGNLTSDWLRQHLDAKNRRVGPKTAPPQGLYLVHVSYRELNQKPNWPPLIAGFETSD